MNDKNVRTEIQKWLDNTWNDYPPEFLITIHYKDLPTKIERVKEHIHHFNNVLFRKFHGVSRSVKVPPITQRIMVQHFHEINPIRIRSKNGLPKQKLVYHTHTYISNTKNYFRDKEHFREFLNTLYKEKSPYRRRKYKKTRMVKSWTNEDSVKYYEPEYHRSYCVDSPKKLSIGNSLFDETNSDLIPIFFQ